MAGRGSWVHTGRRPRRRSGAPDAALRREAEVCGTLSLVAGSSLSGEESRCRESPPSVFNSHVRRPQSATSRSRAICWRKAWIWFQFGFPSDASLRSPASTSELLLGKPASEFTTRKGRPAAAAQAAEADILSHDQSFPASKPSAGAASGHILHSSAACALSAASCTSSEASLHSERYYVGLTSDVPTRRAIHNSGGSLHLSRRSSRASLVIAAALAAVLARSHIANFS